MPAVKIFSEAPFGSIAEPLARGCLVFCISWEKAEVVTPMADPSWSQDLTRLSKTQGLPTGSEAGRRDTSASGQHHPAEGKLGLPSWDKVLPQLGTAADERGLLHLVVQPPPEADRCWQQEMWGRSWLSHSTQGSPKSCCLGLNHMVLVCLSTMGPATDLGPWHLTFRVGRDSYTPESQVLWSRQK